jgi:hypothetical protein
MKAAATIIAILGCGATAACDSDNQAQPVDAAAPDTAEVRLATPHDRVLISGKRKEVDPITAKAAHDDYAASVRARLPQHLAFAGQINLMTQERDDTQLVLLDAWDDRAALDQFYADAATAQRLAALFEVPPRIETFQRPDGWVYWGDSSYATATTRPAYLIRTRGRLQDVPLDQARLTHNATAGDPNSVAAAKALSDIAHIAHLGAADPRELLFFDIWGDLSATTGAARFFGDERTQQGAMKIFEAAPDVRAFDSTDWSQWDTALPRATPLDGAWQVTALTCNGAAQPIGSFVLNVHGTSGTFLQDLGPTCSVALNETYETTATTFAIVATGTSCSSPTACGALFGIEPRACPPAPAKTEFTYAQTASGLTFQRTAALPSDPCPPGQAIAFTLARK